MAALDDYDWDGMADGVEDILREYYPDLFKLAYQEASGVLPVKISFDLKNPHVKDAVARLGKNIRGVSDTVKGNVQRIVGDGLDKGDSVQSIAKALREYGVTDSASRADTIARTETAVGYNAGAVLAYREAKVEKVTVLDGDGDEECAAADGQVWTLEEAEEKPVAHPNCLVGDTLVVAPYQLRRKTFARRFDGEVVTIRTANNDSLTCTPNHPVLTTGGWVAAGLLDVGGDVIHALDSERIATLLDPDDKYMPASIQEMAGTALVTRSMTARVMPCATEDFHGDGIGSHIYIETADGSLSGGVDAPRPQIIDELFFERAIEEAASLAGLRSLDKLLVGGLSPADGLVSIGGTGGALVRGKSGVANGRSFRQGAGKTGAFETAADATGLDVVSESDIVAALASFIEPVNIVEVERREFHGHVYNLQTEQGWYIANNIITHNCTRAFAPYVGED